jgi:hypothetical protein
LNSQAIADVKQLQGFPLGAEVQAAISQDAINVQHQQANGSGGFFGHCL